MENGCKFCDVINKKISVKIVFEDSVSIAFLDSRPVFIGHCLLIPKKHFQTIMEAPDDLVDKLFENTKKISSALIKGLGCDGILLIENNVVSQSIPHLHTHIIPRRKGEALKGFMWPRRSYADETHIEKTQKSIKNALLELGEGP